MDGEMDKNNGQQLSEPILCARNLSVRFGSQPILLDISLDIMQGQTVSIIGESGCGKTVFLKTLISLVTPTSGEVTFRNQKLYELSDRALTRERLRFGFVFQNAALFDSMTIYDNIAFPLREHRNMPEPEIRQNVLQRLREVGLSKDVMQKRPAEISGGMRKRVGLARAVAMNPEVMLYDEPTTGLDPIMSDVINELILRMRQSRPVTSIVVTHDMKTARKVSDRLVMFYPRSRLTVDQPQILYDGPPEGIDSCPDPRVTQFVHGEAGERLSELERGQP